MLTMKPIVFLISILTAIPAFAQENFFNRLAESALELTSEPVDYDPSYYTISYPNGDIPRNKGVCTDVIIRAYRKMGIDLQKEVHEDMKANFSKYPRIWGLNKPDKNIDHRRVPNLMVFLSDLVTLSQLRITLLIIILATLSAGILEAQ